MYEENIEFARVNDGGFQRCGRICFPDFTGIVFSPLASQQLPPDRSAYVALFCGHEADYSTVSVRYT